MRPRQSWLGILAISGWYAMPAPAVAQPVGSEFQVNTYTTSAQDASSVAADEDGNFVVVWESCCQDGHLQGIFAQRFDSAGVALGSEFRVNSYTTLYQRFPSVASNADGDFIVVWESRNQDGSGMGVFGQRYDSQGMALGSEFRVNSYTTSDQGFPSVASDLVGNFVVVWTSRDQDDDGLGVFGQRFDSVGMAQGPEFRVNSYTTSHQASSSVASDSSGNFVVVWQSNYQDGDASGVFGQRFDSGGMPRGSEFRVNSYTTAYQSNPAIASDASGNFVVVWDSRDQDGDGLGVFGQRFDNGGMAQGSEFRVNSYTTANQFNPAIASDARGKVLVTWSGLGHRGSGGEVFGRHYDGEGRAREDERHINSFTPDNQVEPSVVATGVNEFVVIWTSSEQDGANFGVFGKLFDLSRDASGR